MTIKLASNVSGSTSGLGQSARTARALIRGLVSLLAFLGPLLNTHNADADTIGKPIDSGIYVDSLVKSFWVNNEQLLFGGFDRAKPKDVVEARQLRRVLYLWSIDQEPQVYARDLWPGSGSSAWHCAADGVVWVKVRSDVVGPPLDDTDFQLVGRPGSERIQPLYRRGREQPFNPPQENCDRNYPSTMSSRIWAVDSFNDYYVDFGERPFNEFGQRTSSPKPTHVMLKRLRGDSEVALPIDPEKVLAICTKFFRFSGTFLISDCHRTGSPQGRERWRTDSCLPVWLVSPSLASTEKICIPYGAWQGPIASLSLTRAGLFFASLYLGGRGSPDPGVAGLYQMKDVPKQVLRGVVHSVSVSPDGCKLAFSYAPRFAALNYGTAGSNTLVVISVCQ